MEPLKPLNTLTNLAALTVLLPYRRNGRSMVNIGSLGGPASMTSSSSSSRGGGLKQLVVVEADAPHPLAGHLGELSASHEPRVFHLPEADDTPQGGPSVGSYVQGPHLGVWEYLEKKLGEVQGLTAAAVVPDVSPDDMVNWSMQWQHADPPPGYRLPLDDYRLEQWQEQGEKPPPQAVVSSIAGELRDMWGGLHGMCRTWHLGGGQQQQEQAGQVVGGTGDQQQQGQQTDTFRPQPSQPGLLEFSGGQILLGGQPVRRDPWNYRAEPPGSTVAPWSSKGDREQRAVAAAIAEAAAARSDLTWVPYVPNISKWLGEGREGNTAGWPQGLARIREGPGAGPLLLLHRGSVDVLQVKVWEGSRWPFWASAVELCLVRSGPKPRGQEPWGQALSEEDASARLAILRQEMQQSIAAIERMQQEVGGMGAGAAVGLHSLVQERMAVIHRLGHAIGPSTTGSSTTSSGSSRSSSGCGGHYKRIRRGWCRQPCS